MTGVPQTQPSAPPPVLPELRQELRLESGAPGANGAPTWLIVDPVQHRYIQLDDTAHQILSLWRAGATQQDLAQSVGNAFGHPVTVEEVSAFVRFLTDNNLTVEPSANGWRHYAGVVQRSKHGWLMWMVHNYLFIKIPLVRPEPALKRLLPLVAPLFSRGFFIIVALVAFAGLYLVSRQLDAFAKTFQHFFSWQGAVTYAIALALIKSAHELGHAFTAVRFGCRVPSMGMCFLVMFPVLYTDVTDAWRIRSRRERLLIGSAGIIVELVVAAFATLAWPFLPEGVFKSLAFSIATVGWVLSLFINLNPLMRFDGYYLFADALGIDNLQSRSFAIGQWRMRELLFNLKAPPPEMLPQRTATILTIYAWSVWIYRFILFTGIALLVYHMAFKVLGIILFLVEIIYFIAKPIYAEGRRWMQERKSIAGSRRAKAVGLAALAALCLTVVPWSTQVNVPAVLESADISRVYPQRPGIVTEVRVKSGDPVKSGDVLVILTSPDIEHQTAAATRRMALLKMQLARRSADAEDRAKSIVMEQELTSIKSELAGLKRESEDLIVKAPQDGVIAEFNTAVHAGRAVSRSEVVALIRGADKFVARGYIAEQDIARLSKGAKGSFVADEIGYPRYSVQLEDIAKAGTSNIDILELASVHGGPVAVRPLPGDANHRRLTPVQATYLATLSADTGGAAPGYSIRGTVQIKGEGRSLAARAWRQVASVLVRESGF